MICYCTDACEFSKPIVKSKWKGCKEFVENFENWKKLTNRFYIWDYSANFKYLFQPFECCHVLSDNLRCFRNMGVFGVLEEGDHYGVKCVDEALKTWLIGHMLWNPDQPLEPLLERFFAGYYGAAAGTARAYYDALVALEKERDEARFPLVMWGIPLNDTAQPLSFFDEWSEKWTAALDLVKDDPLRSAHVYWARHNVDLVRLVRAECAAKYSISVGDGKKFEMKTKELKSVAKRILTDFERVKGLNKFRDSKLVRSRVETVASIDVSLKNDKTGRVIIPASDLRIDDRTATKLVDDPLAVGGKAIRMGSAAPGEMHHCIAFREDSFLKDEGVGVKLRIHARIEKNDNEKGTAFSVGTCDMVTYAKRDIKNFHINSTAETSSPIARLQRTNPSSGNFVP